MINPLQPGVSQLHQSSRTEGEVLARVENNAAGVCSICQTPMRPILASNKDIPAYWCQTCRGVLPR